MKRISTATPAGFSTTLGWKNRVLLIMSCVIILGGLAVRSKACPLCLAPSQTWAEMVTEADIVLLGEMVSNDEGSSQKTPFSLVKVLKIHKGDKLISAGKVVRIDEFIFAEPGDFVLLKGSLQDARAAEFTETFASDVPNSDVPNPESATKIQKVSATVVESDSPKVLHWDFYEQCTLAGFEYLTTAPSLEQEPQTRLKFFIPFLEHHDALVAADAWGEFANAEYEDIKAISQAFSTADLRQWISDPDAEPERRGLYGLMLGMCGAPVDMEFLWQQIGQPNPDEIRFGSEGLMGGFLVLSPEHGLQFLEESWLNNPKATAFDLLPVIKALQFAWTYEAECFEKERLRAALRPLLKREELREIVIPDLARWEDWNAVSLMLGVYEASQAEDPRTVLALANFLVLCRQSAGDAEATDNSVAARDLLEVIRKDNARIVRMAEAEFAE